MLHLSEKIAQSSAIFFHKRNSLKTQQNYWYAHSFRYIQLAQYTLPATSVVTNGR